MSTPPPSDPPTQPQSDDPDHPFPGLPRGEWPDPGTGAAGSAGGGRPRDGLGTAALVLGVVGIVLAVSVLGGLVLGGLVLGVVALIFGVIGLRRARRGDAANRGEALTGTILGAIAIVLSVATVVGILVVGIGPLASTSPVAASAPARAQRQQCVAQAHGDQSAVRACRRQFDPPRRPGAAT